MLLDRATRLYDFVMTRVFDRLKSPFLFVFRAYWGWEFFRSGRNKLDNIEGIVDYFATLGIPAPAFNAHFVSWLECVGGILLILGLFSRPIAAVLTANMTVAYVTGDRERVLHIFSAPDKFIAADPYPYLLVSLIVLAFGPRWFALDTLLSRLLRKKTSRNR